MTTKKEPQDQNTLEEEVVIEDISASQNDSTTEAQSS